MNIARRSLALSLLTALLILTTAACISHEQRDAEALAPPPSDAPYRNPNLSTDARVEDLLGRMTLEEKLGQMTQVDIGYLSDPRDVGRYLLGSVLSGGNSNPADNSPDGWADLYDDLQQQALGTRLGIPILYGIDAVHGHNNLQDATVFPHNIGLGATRNPELVERIARATALEMAGTGMRWNFGPAIGVPRDTRWGRTYEGFSENPQLVGDLGAAAIRGYQTGASTESAWVLATPKHWVGDGGTEGGIDQGDTALPLAELVELHGSPYRPAIAAGARVIMASYNSWNGEKVHGSRSLLTDVLRDEFGFNGMILSDWGAIYQLPGSESEQTLQAIDAGIDMNMVPDDYRSFISTMRTLVETGALSAERIDDAVRRILTIKFDMGLFEEPFADRSHQATIRSDEHLELGRQAVRESLVLLRNENETLPIREDIGHIHVTGRFADDIGAQAGGWTIDWQGVRGNVIAGSSIRQAITNAAPDGTEVSFAGSTADGADTREHADLIVAVIGEAPYAEFEGDRNNLNLHPTDRALLEAVSDGETPVVVVLLSGRPLVLTDQLPMMDALVAAWLPGSEGDGVADVLFGTAAPSGRLPITWPRSNDQIPIQRDGDRGGLWSRDDARAAGYGVSEASDSSLSPDELAALPLFPYGFGLGYEPGDK
ncbi:MAG: beta-glucosidase [Spirochaetaceae bacterium]|nr:MAG: beta-glucosidase [Spirochaetaceae bacterium]